MTPTNLVSALMRNGPPDHFITVKEAARDLRVNTETIYNYIRDGKGPPHTKFGRTIRIHNGDEFVAWKRKGFKSGASPKGK